MENPTDEQRRERARNWLKDGAIMDGYPLHNAPLRPVEAPSRTKPAFAVVAPTPRRRAAIGEAPPAAQGGLFESKEAA